MLLNDDSECKRIYDTTDKTFKAVCPWEETQKMRLYQRKLFKLRLIKNMYSMAYDMAFIYFLMPKMIWEFLLWTFHSLEWCNGDWGDSMQLIVAAAFALIYKMLDIIVHVPFGAY